VTATKADWQTAAASGDFASTYAGSTVNTILIGLLGTNIVGVDVYDGAGGLMAKHVNGAGLAPGSTHRLLAHASSGVLNFYLDGVLAGVASGVGSGLLTAAPTTMGIGAALNNSRHAQGALSNLKIRVNPKSWRECF
jgi:hypothetical protein